MKQDEQIGMNITIESFFLVAEQDHIQVPSNENNFCA
jgi:poly(3-hydroxyalkanoate) synthetase